MRVARWIAMVIAVAGCGGSGYGGDESDDPAGPNPTPVQSATVQATPQLQFTPTPVNLLVGGTVTFSFGATAHNVLFDATAGAPASIPGSNANTSIARSFPTAGNFRYVCDLHPGMTGRVVVQ
ncbi:MAG TPA: plastocyanin/azurin family copper-binding protein [Gemmatimonadaceae bacterium]|nr:plastocyanin/azurin family copper-binding protein [Gemmatimonadaceae bacterium]